MQSERLEPRYLLSSSDVLPLGSTYSTEPIRDPFAYGAVTPEQMAARAERHPYVPGELVVALQLPVVGVELPQALDQIGWSDRLGIGGVTALDTVLWFERAPGTSVALVQLDLGTGDVMQAMHRLVGFPDVMWSSPNFYFDGDDPRQLIPNDPQFDLQYHHPLMHNVEAWDVTLGDSSLVVAITDDGVDLDHADLGANIWTNPGEIAGDGIDNEGNGYIDDVNGWDFPNNNNDPNPDGGDSHGTHVAGISAAVTNNGVGVAGTAGGATIMPLQFYDSQDSELWTAELIAETFAYAVDNGARIINTSYVISRWVGDPVYTAGLQYVYDQGGLHFNAAENANMLNPRGQAFEQTLLVASTDSADRKSSFSNYGTGIDISAPGSVIRSTLPNDGYGVLSGTSMAAPNAAGVAALIWSHNPTWTRDQVAAQLLATADNIDAINPGYEGLLGSGRANSFRALTETIPAPKVKNVTGLPLNGTMSPLVFELAFDQVMDPASVNDLASYDLRATGPDGLFDTADDDVLVLSAPDPYLIGTNQLTFEVTSGPWEAGDYRLSVVSGGVQNPFGTALDGNADGLPGDDYQLEFSIPLNPFERVEPLGSLIARSTGNFAALTGPTDIDQFTFFAEAGQNVTAIITPDNPAATLTGQFAGGPLTTASAPGQPVVVPEFAPGATGDVPLVIASDTATGYHFDIFRNVNVQALQESADPVAIDDSLVQLGSGRYAAVGDSVGFAGGLGFKHYNYPGMFIDISETGTSLALPDEGEATITTTVGNSLFPSGDVTVANNGGIMAGGGLSLDFRNTALPTTKFSGTALLPFWDDIDSDTGDVYWEERPVGGINTLIVQWHNRPHYQRIGSATFQLQLFESGPVVARFVYADVDFGYVGYDGGASATIGYQEDSTSAQQFSFDTAAVANGDVVEFLSGPLLSDVDLFTVDLTGSQGASIDIVLDSDYMALANATLELLDPFNTVVATGSSMPLGTTVTNYDQGIIDYSVSTAGVYTVRVSADVGGRYSLLVTDVLVFDTEPNDGAGDALRSLDSVDGALGHWNAGTDRYEITLEMDQEVVFETRTPADHPDQNPLNTFDPNLELRDETNTLLASDANSADGKNARIVFTATSAGVYTVIVGSDAGSGEYLLLVDPGASGDFNGDGFFDCLDINALTAEIAGMTNNLMFDMTGDGVVDLADRDEWLEVAALANGFGEAYLLGDADLNGTVDGADFLAWNDSKFTAVDEWCSGDFTADGFADGLDFGLWNANKFQSITGRSAPQTAQVQLPKQTQGRQQFNVTPGRSVLSVTPPNTGFAPAAPVRVIDRFFATRTAAYGNQRLSERHDVTGEDALDIVLGQMDF